MTDQQQMAPTPDKSTLWRRFNWWFWGVIVSGLLLIPISTYLAILLITIYQVPENVGSLEAVPTPWPATVLVTIIYCLFLLCIPLITGIYYYKFTKKWLLCLLIAIGEPALLGLLYFASDLSIISITPLLVLLLIYFSVNYFTIYGRYKKNKNAQIPNS